MASDRAASCVDIYSTTRRCFSGAHVRNLLSIYILGRPPEPPPHVAESPVSIPVGGTLALFGWTNDEHFRRIYWFRACFLFPATMSVSVCVCVLVSTHTHAQPEAAEQLPELYSIFVTKMCVAPRTNQWWLVMAEAMSLWFPVVPWLSKVGDVFLWQATCLTGLMLSGWRHFKIVQVDPSKLSI